VAADAYTPLRLAAVACVSLLLLAAVQPAIGDSASEGGLDDGREPGQGGGAFGGEPGAEAIASPTAERGGLGGVPRQPPRTLDPSITAKGAGYTHTWTTNPGSSPPGQPWTIDAVNALEAGVVKAGGSSVEFSQMYVIADFDATAGATTYVYNDGPTGMNELLLLKRGLGTTAFTYDTNGNLRTKSGGWTYDWNYRNLLAKASIGGAQQQAYAYDALGRRVRVEGASPSTWTVSIVSGMETVFERDQTGVTTKYVYAAGMRVARIDCGNQIPAACTTRYYLGDHLGSTRKVMDEGEPPAVAYSAEYEPFGKPYNVQGVEGHRYTGEKHDDPTGLVYLRARQYDPELGRFVSADPLLGSLSTPQTQNRYAYVANNPLAYVDATGLDHNVIRGYGVPSGCSFSNSRLCSVAESWPNVSQWESEVRAKGDPVALSMGFIPGLETASDAWFLFWSTADLLRNPSWENLGWWALDFASLLVPGVSFGTWVRTGNAGAPIVIALFRKADNIPVGGADEALEAAEKSVRHHTIPRAVLQALDPSVAGHSLVRGVAGHPNRWPIPESLHHWLHGGSGLGKGGRYNTAWWNAIEATGKTPRQLRADEVLEIRDMLVEVFGVKRYRP